MRQDIEALESTTFGGKRFTRKQLCDMGATRRPRPLRGEWHAEIRVVGGIS
jgi:hypothetical protein